MIMKFKWRIALIVAISVVAIPIMAGLCGDILKGWWLGLDDWNKGMLPPGLVFGLLVGLSALLIACVVRLSQKFLPVEIHALATIPPHPVVITLLSNQTDLTYDETRGLWQIAGQTLPPELAAACDKSCVVPGFKWQQNLRAAAAHRSRLRRLYLVGSGGQGGSASDAVLAERFFAHYFPDIEISLPLRDNEAPDFENLDATRDSLNRIIQIARAHGTPERDIVIDLAGGQKTASIAAVLVTLDRPDLIFQYAGTGNQVGTILGFNAQAVVQDNG